jgi:hypothetical protein
VDHPLRPGPRDMRCWLAGWGRESSASSWPCCWLPGPPCSLLHPRLSRSRHTIIPHGPRFPFFPLLPHAVEDGAGGPIPAGSRRGQESLASWQGAQGRFFECKGAHETVEGLVSGRGDMERAVLGCWACWAEGLGCSPSVLFGGRRTDCRISNPVGGFRPSIPSARTDQHPSGPCERGGNTAGRGLYWAVLAENT